MDHDLVEVDPFERRHVGTHGAFTLRINRGHVEIARSAVAHRLDIPVGVIEIDWEAVRPPKLKLVRGRVAA